MGRNTEQLIRNGISGADAVVLASLDPSRTKKYFPFIVKSFRAGITKDMLRNRISEYDTLVSRNIADRKDINSFGSFAELDLYVQGLNNVKSHKEIKRECKKDAEIIVDDDSLFVVCPHSHAASQLYGAGTKWCTTMANSAHFDNYYFRHMVTFYYVQLRSEQLKQNLRADLHKLAIVAYPNGRLEVYDAADTMVGGNRTDAYKKDNMDKVFNRLQVNKAMFKPRSIDQRLEEYLNRRKKDTDINLNRFGISKLPDCIGYMPKLKTLILSENHLATIPDSVGRLSGLTTLYLFYNQLSILPESLSDMKQLQWLGLTGNPLPKSTIRELKMKLPNTRIYSD